MDSDLGKPSSMLDLAHASQPTPAGRNPYGHANLMGGEG